jgi:hypothetical protein
MAVVAVVGVIAAAHRIAMCRGRCVGAARVASRDVATRRGISPPPPPTDKFHVHVTDLPRHDRANKMYLYYEEANSQPSGQDTANGQTTRKLSPEEEPAAAHRKLNRIPFGATFCLV